jgi:protein-tyrosine phosphatase
MIDLHCHLLPGVDDGSKSVEQSINVLTRMAAQGVTEVCLTPHLSASRVTEGPPPEHDEAFARLSSRGATGVKLHRGAEVLLDRNLTARAIATRRITLGGTRYLLVEFTRFVAPTSVTAALQHLIDAGLVPVVAHPERYPSCSVTAMASWKDRGARLQVDANTLFHATGRGRRARAILEAGLADILAADNHGDSRSLAEPFERIKGTGGEEIATLLMVTNPAAILANQPTLVVEPFALKVPLWSRLRGWFDEMGP